MNVYKYCDEHTDQLFTQILEFFSRDSDSADVAWYFFLIRKVPEYQQTEAYKVLARLAKIKYGKPKRKPAYTGEIYLKALKAVKKIIIWIQKIWMRARHLETNIMSSMEDTQMLKLLNSNLLASKEYAILFSLIKEWKPQPQKKQII